MKNEFDKGIAIGAIIIGMIIFSVSFIGLFFGDYEWKNLLNGIFNIYLGYSWHKMLKQLN